MPHPFSNSDLARCAKREVGKRRTVYNNLIRYGRMSEEEATREIAMMEAIQHHYEERAKEDLDRVHDEIFAEAGLFLSLRA